MHSVCLITKITQNKNTAMGKLSTVYERKYLSQEEPEDNTEGVVVEEVAAEEEEEVERPWLGGEATPPRRGAPPGFVK